MPSSYHERDTTGHVALWITWQGIELRATEVSHPFGTAASSARLWMSEQESRGKTAGGACEAPPAVALLMAGGGIAWLAIREAMPSGAVVVAAWAYALGCPNSSRRR